MRKAVTCAVAVFVAVSFTGCAAMTVSPVPGMLYTQVKAPTPALASPVGEVDTYSKTGTASVVSILGLIASGDASIEEAMKDGGITKIHHVDYRGVNILGVYATYTTIVHGE